MYAFIQKLLEYPQWSGAHHLKIQPIRLPVTYVIYYTLIMCSKLLSHYSPLVDQEKC